MAKITEAENKGSNQLYVDEDELTDEIKDDQTKYQDILVQEVMDYERKLNPGQCYTE